MYFLYLQHFAYHKKIKDLQSSAKNWYRAPVTIFRAYPTLLTRTYPGDRYIGSSTRKILCKIEKSVSPKLTDYFIQGVSKEDDLLLGE